MPALALVATMLLGSVLIPARLSYRILHLLGETTGAVEPARLAASQLQSGLDAESGTLQRYVLFGDAGALRDYRATVAEDDRALIELDRLAATLRPEISAQLGDARRELTRWRQNSDVLLKERLSPDRLEQALRVQQAVRDAALGSVHRVAVSLAAEDADRNARIGGFELRSLTINAALVLVSLATLFAVGAVVRHERRLTLLLQRRVQNEAALREAAEAFSAAFGRAELANQIASAALSLMRAPAAFVEEIKTPNGRSKSRTVVVQALAGIGTPPLGVTKPFAGSLAERVADTREPLLVSPYRYDEDWCEAPQQLDPACSAIVVPLADSVQPIGALLVLRESERPFDQEDVDRARTLAHLIWIACEKVRLFEKERAGRRELERVVTSRSRLMRGFSHDVKNPLGAADGYAELLSSGIYGDMPDEQRRAVDSIHKSIQTALALIDDLHELALAEKGSVTLSVQRVELRALVLAAREEYRAATMSRALTLTVDVPADDPVIAATDRARVRQIMSNLISNAIKYTPAGSIGLRLRQRDDATGSWAAIEVTDTGIGIPPDKQQLVFQEFVRLGSSDAPGAGLGLAISQRLASTLGGRITVESEVGRGSTFTLWLPLHPGNAARPAVAQSTMPALHHESREHEPG